MVKYSVHIKGLVLPVAGIVCLEFLWNILGFIINPILLDIPLHLSKYGLYALAGYIASNFFNSETTEAVVHGGIAGGLGAIIEGLLVSPLFYGWFFYMPGFPFFHSLYHIFSLSITGAFFGFIGSFMSSMTEFDFISQYVQTIFINPMMKDPKLNGVLNFGNESHPEATNFITHTNKVDANTIHDDGIPNLYGELTEEEAQLVQEAHPYEELSLQYELSEEDLRIVRGVREGDQFMGYTKHFAPTSEELRFFERLRFHDLRYYTDFSKDLRDYIEYVNDFRELKRFVLRYDDLNSNEKSDFDEEFGEHLFDALDDLMKDSTTKEWLVDWVHHFNDIYVENQIDFAPRKRKREPNILEKIINVFKPNE